MPSTTNFGWTTPADTDYVKDGASAIRTLAGGIDTSMAQLKGGTTGQILSKTNGTDMAFTWINNDQGDITGVTAGTGISGGGTTGTVTITNSMATAITTNGDLIYGTGSGTFSRLGIGSTNQILTVSGGVPTWATPASSASGLTLITSTTVSAATSKSIDNCFTSTYDNYVVKIVLTAGAANNSDVTVRLRASSTDSSANYTSRRILGNQNGISTDADTSGTDEWFIGSNDSSYVNTFTMNLYNPQKTTYTGMDVYGVMFYAGYIQNIPSVGQHKANTSYDGFTILSTNNMTGTIRVYGYQNS